MQRLTKKTEAGYEVEQGCGAAIAKLAQFENLVEDLGKKQATLTAELETLRTAGKEKTLRFRETLGKKALNSQFFALLHHYGLVESEER